MNFSLIFVSVMSIGDENVAVILLVGEKLDELWVMSSGRLIY